MQAEVEVQSLPVDLCEAWSRLLLHRREPGLHSVPPPIWRDLRLPRELPCRLRISGGDPHAGQHLLREIDLTPR
jgi:hypothetical protein